MMAGPGQCLEFLGLRQDVGVDVLPGKVRRREMNVWVCGTSSFVECARLE